MKEYDFVRQRVKIAEGIFPPSFSSLTHFKISLVWDYLDELLKETSRNDNVFSADRGSLFQHLLVMENYLRILLNYPNFLELGKKIFPELTEDFLVLLILLHDYVRFIFNGPVSLTYLDGVCSGLLKKRVLPKMFPDNLRVQEKILSSLPTIDWITGKKLLPENDEELTDEEKLGLILKAIDTLGKVEPDGRLRDPESFFSEDGGYFRWLEFQIKMNRFPLKITPDTFVDAKTYAKQDIRLTIRGISLIEKLTGKRFGELRKEAEERWNNLYQTSQVGL